MHVVNHCDVVSEMEHDALAMTISGAVPFASNAISLISFWGGRCPSFAIPQTVVANGRVAMYFIHGNRSLCVQKGGLAALVCLVVLLTFGLSCCFLCSPILWKLIWLLCWVLSVVLLLKIHCVGPGYIGLSSAPSGCANHQTVELSESVSIRCQHCRTCSVLRPPRASHCRLCGACVARYDHHCVMVGSCIGRDNVGYFVAFVWFVMAILLTSLAVAVSALNGDNYIAALIVIVIDTLCFVPVAVASVFYFVCYLVYGVTFREWKRRGAPYVGVEIEESWAHVPRPFNQGFISNFLELFSCRS
jgi:ribosomal protein L40E